MINLFSKKAVQRSLSIACIVSMTALLGACGSAERLSRIGQEPEFTKFENPQQNEEYHPVSIPMPTAHETTHTSNSLWQSNRQTFFKDQRANDIGDILTVLIEISDEAELENESSRTRTSADNGNIGALAGLQSELADLLPGDVDLNNLVNVGSDSNAAGTGTIEREEEIELELAAVITQILPNGNMVIYGRQEVRVNYELREIKVAGIIRPEDIQSDNTITHEKIAEARIAYGGRGYASDVQKPKYGQEFLDVVFPF